MIVLALGASRNIGYYSCLRLLEQGHDVIYLLRRTNAFDDDASIKPFITSGKAQLIQGDALKKEDVQRAWDKAAEKGPIDFVLFSIGGVPAGFSVTKGAVLDPPDLCTKSILTLFSIWPKSSSASSSPQPKLIVVTTNGNTSQSYSALPSGAKLFTSWALRMPYRDKKATERVIFEAAGKQWIEKEKEEYLSLLPSDWKSTIGEGGWLEKDYLIVRPSFLTSGEALAESGKSNPYRVSDDGMKGAWTVSRKDVGHFIAEKAVKEWDSYKGREVVVSY